MLYKCLLIQNMHFNIFIFKNTLYLHWSYWSKQYFETMGLILKGLCALGVVHVGFSLKDYIVASLKISELRNDYIHSRQQIQTLLKGKGKEVVKLLKMSCQQSDNRFAMTATTHRNIQQNALIRFNYRSIFNVPRKFEWVSDEVKDQVLTIQTLTSSDLFAGKHVFIKGQQQASRKSFLASLFESYKDHLLGLFHNKKVLPAYGLLLSTFQLVKNRSFLVECLLDDGKITPKIMGLTKQDIIQYFKTIKKDSVIEIFMGLALIYVCYLQSKKVNTKDPLPVTKEEQRKINYLSADVDRILTCQVCRVNCSNVIIRNCMHMCICRQCLFGRSYIRQCPLCGERNIYDIISIKKFEE